MGKHKVKPKARRSGEKAPLRAKVKKKQRGKVREKGKASKELTVPELLHKIEECLDAFQYEEALRLCEQALTLEPRSAEVLDVAGPLLLELGHTDRAIKCFKTAVELSPSEGHSKYMYLGQLSSGEEAVGYLTTGIEIMAAVLQRAEQNKQTEVEGACASVPVEEEGGVTAEDLCTAYCSLAEVYLTDSCFVADAEQRCFECCSKAVEHDPSNPEAYQLLASCLLSQDKQEEAKSVLFKGVSLWLPGPESESQEAGSQGMDPPVGEGQSLALEAPPPPYFSRVNCAKLLLELNEHECCSRVLEGLLREDDEVVVVWYLMGWLHYLMDDHDSARFFLEQTERLFSALGCDDTDLLEHTRTLLQEIGPEETVPGATGEREGGGGEEEVEADCSREPSEHEDSMDVT